MRQKVRNLQNNSVDSINVMFTCDGRCVFTLSDFAVSSDPADLDRFLSDLG